MDDESFFGSLVQNFQQKSKPSKKTAGPHRQAKYGAVEGHVAICHLCLKSYSYIMFLIIEAGKLTKQPLFGRML